MGPAPGARERRSKWPRARRSAVSQQLSEHVAHKLPAREKFPQRLPPPPPPADQVDTALLERGKPVGQLPSPAETARPSCVLGTLAPLVEDAFPPLPPPGKPPLPHPGTEVSLPQARRETDNQLKESAVAPRKQPSDRAGTRALNGAPPPPAMRNRKRRRRGGRRQRPRRAPALLPLREPCDTVLYRPLAGMTNFLAHSQEAIAAQLSRVAGAHRVRVNFRLNIVAVDAATDAPLDPLLAVTEICGVPVRATTAPADSCTGYVFGVDRNLSDDTLLANIRCHHCGAYGHVAATCTSEQRCLRCAGAHKTSGCTAKQATCLNCGGPHAATEPRCPSWQHERKVAETLASSELPISRRQATVLVRTTGQRTTQGPQQLAVSRPECNLAGASPTPRATARRGCPSRATRRRLRPDRPRRLPTHATPSSRC
ncbi:hypothetical protein HPB49_005175 [Dermacentor silvarum]|uniref:Uncharacterized protein n=1 Tax=Dermacentor silvarum TaxID=543639 RepID=A0ACB8D2Q2_DERSI|nr:hypothetical protein HPB49_005175 [Dermacentor silvarum]